MAHPDSPAWPVWPAAPAALRRWPDALRGAILRQGARLRAALLAERERWFMWLPVGIGTGIACYFALPVEPPAWLGPLLLLPLLLLCLWAGARRQAGRPVAGLPWLLALLALLALALGFATVQMRAQIVQAPVLEREGVHEIEGRVVLVEDRQQGHRILIADPVLDGLPPARTPARLRVSLRGGGDDIRPGDEVRLLAMLMPPSGPNLPGGFDYARQAWFERLGAVGFAYGAPERITAGAPNTVAERIAHVRRHVAMEVTAVVPGETGAVATALLTGLRGAIPDHVWSDMQTAGLAHLLAISGLHLGLVAGTLFLMARWAMLLVSAIALRLPVKKIAAAIALAGAFCYMLLAGAPIPTQRAFFMTGFALVAVMADRNPFSMRLVAWAAIVVLLLRPESLLGASFQMSFAAVVALIAAYETGRASIRPPRDGHIAWRPWIYVAGVAMTTVIASTATAPLAAYHFQRIATFGIVANLVAVPVTAFWIMPAGLFGLLLIPFGLATWPFVVMGKGIDVVLASAAWAAAMPGAAQDVHQWPIASLIAFALGGLWLAIWRRPWRLFGLAGFALAFLFAALARPPDVVVAADGDLLGVRAEDGRMAISPWRRDSWLTTDWLRRNGHREAATWPAEGAGEGPLRCDALGCVFARGGHKVAFARDAMAPAEDCGLVDLVVAFAPARPCADGTPLISQWDLRDSGGLALWLRPDGIRVVGAEDSRGRRSWTRRAAGRASTDP